MVDFWPKNIADAVTREASPQDLNEDSAWQNGPEFLRLPVDERPVKSAKEIATVARESINKLQKKVCCCTDKSQGKARRTRTKALGANRIKEAVCRVNHSAPCGCYTV